MSVRYTSTRGKQSNLSFEEVVLNGLANDKGLFVPCEVPIFTLAEIEQVCFICCVTEKIVSVTELCFLSDAWVVVL